MNNAITTQEKLMFVLDTMAMIGPVKDAGFCGPLGRCAIADGVVYNCNVTAILRRNPKDHYVESHYSVTFRIGIDVGSDLDVACNGQRDLVKAAEFVNDLSQRILTFDATEWQTVAVELERFFQRMQERRKEV